MSKLTKLEEQGLTKCDKCKKLISEFGGNSFYGDVFTNGLKKDVFNESFRVCLACGKEMFSWLK